MSDKCQSCRKLGTTVCGNDTSHHSCWEGAEKKHYHVLWEIDVGATSEREAAQEALKIQRDPGSTATVFDVTCDDKTVRVDLEE